jgi:hypothetical protein
VTIATVDANGEVTVVGSGAASIIASVGDIRGEYSFSTASLFDEAKGYWTFDDPNNPGKAIKGEDLEINFDVVTEVPGMDASDGAIRGGWEERGVGEEHIKNVTWNHTMEGQLGDDGKTIRNYTVLVDLKLLYQDDLSSSPRQVWAPIHWGENNMGGLACVYVAWADYSAEPDRGIGLRLAWNLTGTWQYFTPKDKEDGSPWFDKTTLKDNEPWFRFVYTFRYSG